MVVPYKHKASNIAWNFRKIHKTRSFTFHYIFICFHLFRHFDTFWCTHIRAQKRTMAPLCFCVSCLFSVLFSFCKFFVMWLRAGSFVVNVIDIFRTCVQLMELDHSSACVSAKIFAIFYANPETDSVGWQTKPIFTSIVSQRRRWMIITECRVLCREIVQKWNKTRMGLSILVFLSVLFFRLWAGKITKLNLIKLAENPIWNPF